MSAIVCGKRSSFFEDDAVVVSKRIRCSSSSPVRVSPPRQSLGSPPPNSSVNFSSAIDHLVALFPGMDKQLLERVLEECGDDLDSAIRSLNELRLGSAENLESVAGKSDATHEAKVQFSIPGILTSNGDVTTAEESSASQNLPMDGAEWVELFVREMMSSSNMDEARTRASRVLEVLEKSICSRATTEVQSCQEENFMLKQQLEALIQENTILKRAVSIQHERQKEFEDSGQELHHLKQLVAQYQEQLRTLEVNNYALSMHLKQAQQGNSIPGRFNPDIF